MMLLTGIRYLKLSWTGGAFSKNIDNLDFIGFGVDITD